MTLIEDLKYRELIYQMTDDSLNEDLNQGKVTFYLGVDPTADSLHIGHLVAYLTARRIESAGNKAILLIGGATGLIGDPRGSGERELLTLEKSLENGKALSKQVMNLFNVTVVNNYDWVSKIDMITFLRDYGKNFSINYMINKDTVAKRLETGISYTEFSYQLLQAIDFEHLYKTKKCQMQIGGQDQWGNITSGLELIRKNHGADVKVVGLTFPLVTKSDGTKFGKSEGGALWLDPIKTSPYEFYQFWINTPDSDVIRYLKQFTFKSKDEIEEISKQFSLKPEERLAQKILASEVTTMVHGKKAYEDAYKLSENLFNGDILNLSEKDIEVGFKNSLSLEINDSLNILDALINTSLASSKREAREFLNSGAITLNGVKLNDVNLALDKGNALYHKYHIIRRGKKKYALIKCI